MNAINIFCDASINLQMKIACAGCLITDNQLNEVDRLFSIQYNATNNSAEILAVLMSIDYAISHPGPKYRIFSDSLISVLGIREWLEGWISRSKGNTSVLISSSGKPVANQAAFKTIYRMLSGNQTDILLFHQNGHINSDMDKYNAISSFKKDNGIDLHDLGLSIDDIAYANNAIDEATRALLGASGVLPSYDARTMYPDISFYPTDAGSATYFKNMNLE